MSIGVVERITGLLVKSKIGRQLLQEEAASTLEERQKLCVRIAELEAELAAKLPDLEKACATARREHQQAKEALIKIQRKMYLRSQEKFHAEHSTLVRVAELRGELRRGAPAAIESFADRLRTLWKEARDMQLVRREERIPTKHDPWLFKTIEYDNSLSRRERILALVEAIRANDALAETPLSAEEIDARQQALLARLPSGSEVAEI